jgi:hypothetical protein
MLDNALRSQSGLVTNDRRVVTLYVFLVSLRKNKSGIKPSPGMICVHLLLGQIVPHQIETFKTLNFNKGALVYKFHWYEECALLMIFLPTYKFTYLPTYKEDPSFTQ